MDGAGPSGVIVSWPVKLWEPWACGSLWMCTGFWPFCISKKHKWAFGGLTESEVCWDWCWTGVGLEEASVCTVHISALMTGIAEAAGLAATRWASPSPGRFCICSSTMFNYWGRGELALFSALRMTDTIFSAGQEKNNRKYMVGLESSWFRERLKPTEEKPAAGAGRWKEWRNGITAFLKITERHFCCWFGVFISVVLRFPPV